ncbi:unnamed protein product [Sphagnum troendelagicum]
MKKQDWYEKSMEYGRLAASCCKKHKYPTALRWAHLSLAILEEDSVLEEECAAAYNNIAAIHHCMGKDEVAVLYYKQSMEHYRKKPWPKHLFWGQLSIAVCWCALGELKATAAALEQGICQSHAVEFDVVPDWPGYSELMEALEVLQTSLRDHADSFQQKADCYALMRYIYRLTGKLENALQMHELCVKHGGSEHDTIGHGLLMAKQDGKGWCFSFPLTSQSCSHVALALPPQEVHMENLDHFRKRDAYNSMGLVLAWQGCFQEAQEHHIKALKLALQHRCPNAAMLTYFYLGQVDHRAVFESHDSPKSHKHYRKGLALAEKLQARAVSPKGVMAAEMLQRMRDLYQHRLQLAKEDPYAIADAHIQLNNSYLGITHNSQLILDSVHQAFDLIGRLPEDSDVMRMLAQCHSHLSLAYFRLLEFGKATDSIDASINLFRKVKDNVELIRLYILKAAVRGDRQQLQQSRILVKQALVLLAEVGDHLRSQEQQNLRAEAHYSLLSIAYMEADGGYVETSETEVYVEEAMTHFTLCKEAAEECGNADTQIKAHMVMANVHNGLSLRFRELARRATSDSAQSTSTPESQSWLGRSSDELLAAEKMHVAHMELARRRGGPFILARSLSSVGQYYCSKHNYAEAQLLLEEAVLLLSDHLFSIEEISGGSLEFMHAMRTTYSALLSCIAAQDDPAVHEEGLVWAERLRSRTLMRAMEHNFKKDPLMGTPKFDRDMQAALKTLKDLSISCQGVIFVEYALTGGEILIWVIKSGSIVLRRRSYNKTPALARACHDQAQNSWGLNDMQLERKDELLRKANQMIGLSRKGVRAFINVVVENVKNSFKADFYLQLLGSFLLDPISEDLAGVTKDQCIVFIPHEELAFVPFAALKLEDEYLIKRHLVAVSMSVRAYANSERRYAGMEVRTDLPRADVLVISNPFPVDSPERMGLLPPYQRLEALRQAELEGQMIAECMQVKVKALHVHHLRGHRAKKLAVMKVLPKAAWVHFACHGFVSEKYPLGALLLGKTIKPMWLKCLVGIMAYLCTWLGAQLPSFLYQRAGAPDSVGILGAEEVLQSVMQAHCVVLNVCNSAQGKVTVDGLFNWSHALQQVGVPSAISCLWEVQDSAACKFMSILYNHLTNKLPLGLAMQKAMIAIIDDGDNWEPKHWASYSMVGVPHVQLPGFRY